MAILIKPFELSMSNFGMKMYHTDAYIYTSI